jgi:hypothetical protein
MSEPEKNVYPLPFGDLPKLELHADAAALRLLPLEPGGTPRLETSAPWLGAEVSREGETVHVRLQVTGNSPFNFFGFAWGKQGWATLYVPEDLDAVVRSEFGRIEARDLNLTSLDIGSQAGSVTLMRVRGRLKLSAEAGKISGEGLAGAIDAETQAGSIDLDIDALAPGIHRAQSQVGKVALRLAPGLAVRLEAHTEMGKVRVRYPSAADAPAVLRLSTELGAVEVRERGDQGHDRHREHQLEREERMREREERFRERMQRRQERVESRLNWGHQGWGHPPEPPRPPTPAGPELRKVLDLVASGKITAEDAEALLQAMHR